MQNCTYLSFNTKDDLWQTASNNTTKSKVTKDKQTVSLYIILLNSPDRNISVQAYKNATMKTPDNNTCCPKFNPDLWEDKVFRWDQKPFIKAKVRTLFYIPLNFGPVMRKLDKKIQYADGEIVDNLCLSYHHSMWTMDVLLAVDKPIKDEDNVILDGEFFSKVYEGEYSESRIWSRDFKDEVNRRGMKVSKMYLWYTACPKCARKYGHNYVAIIGRID